ncbi:hypothetical protein DWB58_21015, partial [candidate division KSB1 bacterium]|nr:hypothetical protein [candidate division KSB1 bacterium]
MQNDKRAEQRFGGGRISVSCLRQAQAADAGFGEPGLRSLAELDDAEFLGKHRRSTLAELDDAEF